MYDLHCHSLLSDGDLLPSEIASRYMAKGYKAIAISDHVDYSNIKSVIESILLFANNWPKDSLLNVLPGVELTHLPPEQFKPLAKLARSKGIKIIVGHGESPVEPVVAGTNHAALEADIDILAHPGMITDEDTMLAKKRGIFLEITARKGHNQTNQHVAAQAKKFGANLIIDTDSHRPDNILETAELMNVARDAGLSDKEIDELYIKVTDFLIKKGVK